MSEVELIEGRGNYGQKGWIISLAGIDTVEKAKQIVGSTLLVKEGDRPELEEGEFYNPDLVGMRVVLKETGRYIGTVINVYNTGASDLLQVILNSNVERPDYSDSSTTEMDSSGPLVWIPFVEAIVPDIDMDMREMQITPPKGLLELNIRSDTRNKKERRLMEWKARKKLQQRLISTKKKICEIGQKHLLEGFRFGEKSQKSSLANQIVDLNLRLFRHAVQSINTPSGSYNFPKFLSETSIVLPEKALRVSHRSYISPSSEGNNGENSELYKEGYRLLEKSKAAFIINISVENSEGCNSEPSDDTSGRSETAILQLQELFINCKRFLKVEEKDISIPVVLVSPAHEIPFYEEFLSNNEYFNFDRQKVEFLEEEKLPVVSAFADQDSNKILLKSPWEILQASIGSGGVLSLLSSHKVLNELNVKGVEYVQVCSLSERSVIGHPLFFGLVKFHGADLGIKIFEGSEGRYEYDMIFSMRYLSKMSKQVDKMQFYAVPEQHEHVELVGKEWNKVEPEAPNSFRFRSSIYSCLNTCSLEKLCIMQITK